MPRYMVEREVPQGLEIPTTQAGAKTCLVVAQNNAEEQVTWVTSYVTSDHSRTYRVYDGPDPDAIRRAAQANGLPVSDITEVRVLDPYFYASAG